MLRGVTLGTFLLGSLVSIPAIAQSSHISAAQNTPVVMAVPRQEKRSAEYCISTLAEFPSDDHEIRYQFFRLTQEMAKDVTPNLRDAMDKFGDRNLALNRPMLQTIEDIANPVLRQAAPEITIANMAYVIDFASICEPIISGQVKSLNAFDPALENAEFNAVIIEDALFLRQILSDSLFRQGADKDPLYRGAVNQYAKTLVTTRDDIEFSSFEAELEALEALYMDDLDGRLKRSNDMINEEIDTETLGDSVALSDSLNSAEKRKAKERQLYSLIRILGGGG